MPSTGSPARSPTTSSPTSSCSSPSSITNSVKYGGEGALRLQIETEGPRKLRAEVIDQGVGFVPVARDRPATEVGGWGLHLVQTLSNRWGVHEGSTHVWFEIDR